MNQGNAVTFLFVNQFDVKSNYVFNMFTTSDVGFECEVNYNYVIVLTFWRNTEHSDYRADMK